MLGIIQSQSAQPYVNIEAYSICSNPLDIPASGTFGPTTAPVSNESNMNINAFQKEQYMVWYKFTTIRDGKLLIDIVPIDTLDNYDFLLFKYDGNRFQNDYQKNLIKPIRSNFARNNSSKKGRTGLSVTGDGGSFSKGIDVMKDEQYYLVLNNVYENGNGHSITFTYLKTFVITGEVYDNESGKPVKAEITWENMMTDEIMGISNSDKTGKFTMPVSISVEEHRFPNYAISVFSDKYFIADSIIPSKAISEIIDKHFIFKIVKLKKGSAVEALGNIYFDPNYATAVPNSYDVINRVFKLMKRNQKIVIQLEGHTNGYWPSTDVDLKLSESRANAIKDILIKKGIKPDRILTKGLGSTKLMYPKAADEIEEGFNRRVEINIISFRKKK